MADKLGLASGIDIKLGLHRKQAQHAVDLMYDFIDSFAPPRPHRWADVMNGMNACLLEFFRHAEIEVRRIDADKHIRLEAD